jgi:predicted PurR-regulated permease PerM
MINGEILTRKNLFWIAVFIVFSFLVYKLSVAIEPFFVGFILAYIFIPIVSKFESYGISKSATSAILVLCTMSAFVMFALIVIPFFIDTMANFLTSVYNKINDNGTAYLNKISKFLRVDDFVINEIHNQLLSNIKILKSYVSQMLMSNIMSSSIIIVNFVINIVFIPVIMFYTLKDWKKINHVFYSLIPLRVRDEVKDILRQIDKSILSYFRAQFLVCIFFAIFYSISLYFIKLKFGFFIGLMIGLAMFVPYVGFLISLIFTLSIAFSEFGFNVDFFYVCMTFVIGQIIDANYTTPKLIGKNIGVHPSWVIFGVFASTVLMGILGAIIALPLTASIAVIIKFFIKKYKNSDYYIS